MKVQLTLVIDISDWTLDPTNEDEVDWLFNTILTAEDLVLVSTEIGDEFGDIVEVKDVIKL